MMAHATADGRAPQERPRADTTPEDEQLQLEDPLRVSLRDLHRSQSWGAPEDPAAAVPTSSSSDVTASAMATAGLKKRPSTPSAAALLPGHELATLDAAQIARDYQLQPLVLDLEAPSPSDEAVDGSGAKTRRAQSEPAHAWPLSWLFACFRRCMANAQPGFYDMNDPVRQKQAEIQQMTELTVSFLESTWVLLLLLGALTSFMAWCIDGAVIWVSHMHARFTDLGGAWLPDYLLHGTFRVLILILGVACTYFVCPSAAGSGIPEMRSILGGFPLPKYLSGRTLIAKCFGLVFALGSGLSIGKEGPFVHLACVIAHQLLRFPLFQQIRRSQDLTHHILAAACAAGVTATFGTPIGGVLFSIEVTTTYYVTSNYWRAFFCSVVGVVVFRMLNSLLSGNSVSLFATKFAELPYQPYEIVFFLVLATMCGLAGALFVRTFRFVSETKTAFMEKYVFSRLPAARRVEPFVYAGVVALVFSLVEFPVGSFMLLSQREVIDDMFSVGNVTSSNVTADGSLRSEWTSPSLALNLLAYTVVRFFSAVLSATVMVPSGIVTPVFATGAAFGRLFGEMIVFFGGGNELAAGYAVVGAASFTAGVTGTVSIAVIVFELTSQLSYMIPVLLCVLIGRSVALVFSLDMYETISRQKNLPQWPDLTKQKSYSLVASDLMRSLPSYWISRHQTLSSLRKILDDSPADVNVYPIVDDDKTMIFLGVIDREELESLVEIWQLCVSGSPSFGGFPDRGSLAGMATSSEGDAGMPITPRSRHIAMSSQLALAGVTSAQARAFSDPKSESTTTVDLVGMELLSLDSTNFHVHRDTFASQVILLVSVHKCPQLFVTARGKIIGVIHASDLLARSRRFTL